MFLGIEIGGTKLQLGVGRGDGSLLVSLERAIVNPARGAEGIREQIERIGLTLIARHPIDAIGIGFGGPVDRRAGRTITSHQIEGWDDFPLADWCRSLFNLPVVLANDSDSAGTAEARFGAGKGRRVVFYINVGSGIGGALVIDGKPHSGGLGIAAEVGHLRPGLAADTPDQTVESLASGWAIAEMARSRLADPASHPLSAAMFDDEPREPELVRQRLIEREEAEELFAGDLLERCGGRVDRLTTQQLGQAALEGNELAREIFRRAAKVVGWAIAQAITLVAPEVVVVGGGVPLLGDELYLDPVRKEVGRYVFPPLRDSFEIVPAALGEEVVVHGVLALAAELTA
jgi:glucokinase